MNNSFRQWLLAMIVAGVSTTALAKTCELTITGNDQMQFDKSELVVGADCDEVKLTLEHVGKLPKAQMGHNWVLTKTADYQSIAMEAQNAGLEKDYLPDDDRIITHTDLVGGGETTSVTFDVSDLTQGGDYTYFCSFPGHWVVMKGKLVIE